MSLIQAKCTNCGANIKVDSTKEAGICESCGTAYITEKVIQNYNVTANSANITSENVTVNIYGKNVAALVEQGVQIIKGKSLFNEQEISELKRLSKELLDIDGNNYYGKLFSFASGFGFKSEGMDYSLVFNLLDESCSQEIQNTAKNIIVGYLKFKTTIIAETTNTSNIGTKLTNLSSLGDLSTLGLVNVLEHFKNSFNADEQGVISKAKEGYVEFIEKCFEHFEEELSLFYFSESSLKEFDFTKGLCPKLSSLNMLTDFAKDIVEDNAKIKELGKIIGAIINNNSKIIGADLICGKDFLKTADESDIIDFKLNKEDVCVSFDIYSDKVVLGEDKITIGDNQYKVEINVSDILFINHCCVVPEKFFYDIVYRVNLETITCYRLICSTADKGYEKIIPWYITKQIKDRDDENWGFNIPIESGFNKYKYVDSNCFLSKNNTNQTNIICFYPSGVFINNLYFRYEKIKHVNVSDFLKDSQRLELGVEGAALLQVFFELKNSNSKFNKVNEILLERVKQIRGKEVTTNKKGGCYIATCVYGSYDCPEVWTLRRYRDDTLGSTWYGRAFIRLYYAISPTLVKYFGKTKWFKKIWKGKLDRMVKKLQENGVESSPYEDKEWK